MLLTVTKLYESLDNFVNADSNRPPTETLNRDQDQTFCPPSASVSGPKNVNITFDVRHLYNIT